MVNILQQEDMVKGLADDRLMQEAQSPSGQIPVFLLMSEVQRRLKTRKEAEPDPSSETISDQLMQEAMGIQQPPQGQGMPPPNMPYPLPSGQGIAPNPQQFPPPQPPNAEIAPAGGGSYAAGGLVQMAGGGTFPYSKAGLTYRVNRQGYPTDEAAFQEALSGRNPWVGEPYPTIGTTDNSISFNPDGSFRSNAEMPSAVQRGIAAAMPMDSYTGAFSQQARSSDGAPMPATDVPTLPAESFGATPPAPTDAMMGLPMTEQPRRSPDPSMAQRAEDLLNPAPVEPSMRAYDSPVPDEQLYQPNMYARAANARDIAEQTGELLTLKNIGKNVSAGGIGAWDSSVPRETEPEYSAGGIGEYMRDIGRTAADYGKDFLGFMADPVPDSVEELYNTSRFKRSNPVAPEKQEQAAAADHLRVQGKPQQPTNRDKIREGIAALGTESGNGYVSTEDQVKALDTSALVKQARDAAWGNALMQLGAGIAGGDLSGGLSKAGMATSQGLQDTRRLQLIGDQSEIQRQREERAFLTSERDAEFNRKAKMLGLDISMEQVDAMAARNLNYDNKQTFYELKNTLSMLTERKLADLSSISPMTDEEKAKLDEQIETITAKLIEFTETDWNQLKGT